MVVEHLLAVDDGPRTCRRMRAGGILSKGVELSRDRAIRANAPTAVFSYEIHATRT